MNNIYNLDMEKTGKIPLMDIVANHIRGLVFSGGLKSGDEIPTVRDLAKRWPVSHVVIQKALAKCSEEGFLLRAPGRKCVVRSTEHVASKLGCVYFVIEQTTAEAKAADKSTASYFMGFLNGLQAVMEKSGVAVNAFTVSGAGQQKNFIDRIKKHPADLVVLMRSKTPGFVDEINGTGTSLVLVEPHVFNEKGFVVHHDEKRAAEDMISSFLRHGCEKLAFLYFDDGKWVTSQRVKFLTDALKASNLVFNKEWCRKLSSREPHCISSAVKTLLKGAVKPDGLIIMNISFALTRNAFKEGGYPISNLKLGIYTEEGKPDFASFVVIVNPYDFGRATGDFLCNSFYKKNIKGRTRKLLVPYKFKG